MTGCSLHAACAISLRRVFLNANETDLCLLVEVSGQKSQRSSLGLCHGYIILLGHTPNLFHYSSLLNAYSENSYYEKAELLMKDLRSSGLTPNKNQSVIQNQKPGWRAWEVSGILGGLMVWAKASGSLSQDGAVVELGDTSWVPGGTRCRPLGPSFGRAWWNADGAPSLGGARCRLKVPDMGLMVMDCFKPLLYH